MPIPLDFQARRDAESRSWQRGHPENIQTVETIRLNEWRVTLDDGSPHNVTLERQRGSYEGTCDCDGWSYHGGPETPCAHLCAIRRAHWEYECGWEPVEDDDGQPVRVVDVEQERADQRVEEIVADGGQRR